MKRFALGMTLALAALFAPSGAAAANPNLVAGTGMFSGQPPGSTNPATLEMNATSDPSGANARGNWLLVQGGALPEDISGGVTCLTVTGNQAMVGGVVTHSGPGSLLPPGSGLLFQIADNGSPGALNDRMIAISVGAPPTVCPAPPLFPDLPITGGNWVVRQGG
jgi:hypothetical protein